MLKPIDKSIKNVLTSLTNSFFYKNFEYKNFKNGDKITFEVEDETKFTNKIYDGIILGLSKKTILIQTIKDNFYALNPKFVKKIN